LRIVLRLFFLTVKRFYKRENGGEKAKVPINFNLQFHDSLIPLRHDA
jgi:hypothetical protein